jgi:16S rRNA (cytosine1402-N4)-methyltransferase
MRYFLRYLEIEKVDGILADLGVSSHHFDESERGFSFRFDSELDMRMNRNKTCKASDIINEYSQENLAGIFRSYGEVEKPWQIAEAIVKYRHSAKIKTTGDLLSAIGEIIPERFRNKSLARVFQALRIEVNGEMEALQEFLQQSADVLNPRGRLVVITYHSLEDRLVKNFLKFGNFEGKPEKDFYGNIIAPLEPVNRKIVTPTEAEIERNPRARSAKLRIAQRTVYEPTRTTNSGI